MKTFQRSASCLAPNPDSLICHLSERLHQGEKFGTWGELLTCRFQCSHIAIPDYQIFEQLGNPKVINSNRPYPHDMGKDKSLGVSEETWKRLMQVKIDYGLASMDAVVNLLLKKAGK